MTSTNFRSRKVALLTTTALAMAVSAAHAQEADSAIRLGPVQVEGKNNPGANPYADPAAPYKADHLSSSKFSEPVSNTPRTVTVLTKEILEDKNATSLAAAARSTAGVTLGTGEGGNSFGDRFFIRGFDARNDVFVDGIRDPGVLIRENFNTEQIEILKGPASSFAGRGTTGGALNIVTKQATTDYDFYNAQVTAGLEDRTKRMTVDLNQTITPTLAIRVNGLLQSAGVAGRDFTTDNRRGIAGALTWTPLEDVTVKASYTYTSLTGLPDFGVPYNPVKHRPVTESDVPRNTYYGITNRDFTRSDQNTGTLFAQWRPIEWLSLENNFRASHSLLNYIGTIPENPSATGATAPYSAVASATAPKYTGYTQLNAQSRYEPVTVVGDQLQAIATFDTGGFRHTFVLGGETSSEHISLDTYTGLTSELTTGPVAFTSSGAPIVSIANPTHQLFTANTQKLVGNPLRYRVNTNSGYLMDTANYNDIVIINGGIRIDNYKISSANNTSARNAQSDITSYNAGIVYKPLPEASLYAAFATSAIPVGSELDATSSTYGGFAATQATTQIFGPQRSKAYEVGVKWSLFDDHLLATVAGFKTEMSNGRETAPAGLAGYTSGQIVAGSAYRVTGVEFGLDGNITQDWSVSAGLVLMDTKVTKSLIPTYVGLRLSNVADESFNLLTKYQFNDWLEFGGQATYTSEINGGSLLSASGGVAYPLPANNPTVLPANARFDLFTEARVSDNVKLKLYVSNILDKTYYDSLYQSVVPFVRVAPGRNVSLIADVKF